MMKKILTIFAIMFLIAGISGCNTNKEVKDENQKVVVTLDWTPNTNHTGLYAALDKGFYKEEGLDVEIIQPAGGTSEQLVAVNQAQFGVSYQEGVTYARANGMPVVSIAAVIQHNTSGFASLASKDIKSPKDFEGKRYGGWGSEIENETIKELMEAYGGDYSKVEILTTGAVDFFASSEKNADFSWIFYGWDGIAAELKGIELNYINVADFDETFDFYTPVIITNEEITNNNKELAEKFMKATSKGYNFAIENPQEAGDSLLKYAPELDSDLVYASQKWLADKYAGNEKVWGIQSFEVWDRYTEWLAERGLLEEKIETGKAFTNEFLLK
jgi:ABC-type nitrate/sulfonate/bicarbonate transport system substrate-binding protein